MGFYSWKAPFTPLLYEASFILQYDRSFGLLHWLQTEMKWYSNSALIYFCKAYSQCANDVISDFIRLFTSCNITNERDSEDWNVQLLHFSGCGTGVINGINISEVCSWPQAFALRRVWCRRLVTLDLATCNTLEPGRRSGLWIVASLFGFMHGGVGQVVGRRGLFVCIPITSFPPVSWFSTPAHIVTVFRWQSCCSLLSLKGAVCPFWPLSRLRRHITLTPWVFTLRIPFIVVVPHWIMSLLSVLTDEDVCCSGPNSALGEVFKVCRQKVFHFYPPPTHTISSYFFLLISLII